MPFRVAGADDVEFRRFFFDEGHEVAGMFEVMGPFTARYFIAAQGKDVFDAGFFQFFQVLKGCFFRTLSHHMKILVDCGLVNDRKEGKWHYYSLNKKVIREASSFVEALGR